MNESVAAIVGAFTRNYLLERTRCATPPEGERNYHSFYQLLAGGRDAAFPAAPVPWTPPPYHSVAENAEAFCWDAW